MLCKWLLRQLMKSWLLRFSLSSTSSLLSRFNCISLSTLGLKCELTWNRSIEFIHAHSEWCRKQRDEEKIIASQITDRSKFSFFSPLVDIFFLSHSLLFLSPLTWVIFIQCKGKKKKSPTESLCIFFSLSFFYSFSFSCECKLNCVWFCFPLKLTK